MRSLLKFLGLALVIVLAGLWIMTVSKSCNNNKIAKGATQLETDLKDKVTEVTDDAESLFEGETEEEGLFNEEGDEISANGTEGADEEEMEDEDEDEEADLDEEIAARERASEAASGAGNGIGTATSTRTSSGLEYMVIGGAFLTEANANAEVKRLKKKGYDDAEVVTFDFSQYHSVCVKRTSSLSEARSTKNKLVKGGNAEAYVHKKRSYKKKQ